MTGRRPRALAAAWVAALGCALPTAAEEPTVAAPRRSGLVERTSARLAQVDVTVTGPREVASSLGPRDFRLKVHLGWIEEFRLDRSCTAPDEGRPGAWQLLRQPAVRYLFYFDQSHLTMPGRARALDLARELVDRLVVDGRQAKVVSDARRLEVVEDFTGDHARVHDALDHLEHSRSQWDEWATAEDARVARVVDVLNRDDNVHRAISTARTFQREEAARTDRSLRRLAITIAQLREFDSSKVVLYFGDTLRQNAGEHYLSFFGPSVAQTTATLDDGAMAAFSGRLAFDQVVAEATAQGIRFYPVYAQGLVTPFDRSRLNTEALTDAGAVSSSSHVRFRDAQQTLANLASETGGHGFLRGETPNRIADRVIDDFTCLYTLSFDPAGLPVDSPLRVNVKLLHPELGAKHRGLLTLESETARRASRLLRAFASAGSDEGHAVELRANLVPTGFVDGSWRALLQIRVPATRIPGASWEVGATVIRRDTVADEVSRTLAVDRTEVALVLEHEVRLRPGDNEIAAVARESTTDFILSDHLSFAWPDPNRQPVSCGPLALLQPSAGAFVREDDQRSAGSLARSDGDPIRPDRPTALMGLVCRGRRHKGPIRVERALIGAWAVQFPPLEFELVDERCAQVRDLIPADSLLPGSYRYILRIVRDGLVVDEIAREFETRAPES